MTRAGRLATALAGGFMALTTLGIGGIVIANSATATQPMAATTWVNMRSGPSMSHGVLAVLAPSQAVTASGTVTNGWQQVTTGAGQSGWVFQTYLRATGPASESSAAALSAPAPTASGELRTTAAVNVRSGPGTDNPIVGVAARGATVATTGTTSGGWTQVVWSGSARWISTNFLTSGTPSTSQPVGQVRATTNLYLRTGGSQDHQHTGVLPVDSVVDVTGATENGYTEIIHAGQNLWIATQFTAEATTEPTPPAAPAATGTVYVTVNALNVRATAEAASSIVGVVNRGEAVQTTGTVVNERLQILHNGVARWVYQPYTSASAPAAPTPAPSTSTSLIGHDRLGANAKGAVQHVIANYPQIRTIGGYRASSDYSSDHPNGRAIDVMIPSWSQQTGIDLGERIARDFQANASRHNVSYIIWRQQIWNASFPERGWRTMENRGSATANHMDHVHVSFRS